MRSEPSMLDLVKFRHLISKGYILSTQHGLARTL